MKSTKSLLGVVPALVLAGASLLGGGVAGATPGPTPSGLTGAANMTNPNALPGMLKAMGTDNSSGRAGMWRAVCLTNAIPLSECPLANR